ncbi:AraC family transcriptional regulator [Rhodobacteraceae bacterium M382]|nr:AraC family transcriptional regulator [Rhodobacteraceae bacterium M382]
MPLSTDGFIRLALVMPLVQHAENQHVDVRPAFESLGLSKDMLRDPKMAVHAEVFYGLVNDLAVLVGDPYFGCHVAEQFDFANWPPIAEAGRNSRTVGEFLCSLVMQVPQESSSVRHALTIEADCATYSVTRLVKTQNQPLQIEGFGAALYLRLIQGATSDAWDPAKVRVYTPFPQAVPRGHMGIRLIKTDGPGLEIKFPSAWLHAGLGLKTAIGYENGSTKDPDLSIVAALRSAARPLLMNRELGAEDVAQKLGLDRKRMEAALRMQNTTAARELKKLRIELAKAALSDNQQTIGMIGRSLGYADQSHFTRFFKSQAGVSPSDFRRKVKAKAP